MYRHWNSNPAWPGRPTSNVLSPTKGEISLKYCSCANAGTVRKMTSAPVVADLGSFVTSVGFDLISEDEPSLFTMVTVKSSVWRIFDHRSASSANRVSTRVSISGLLEDNPAKQCAPFPPPQIRTFSLFSVPIIVWVFSCCKKRDVINDGIRKEIQKA